MSSPAITVPPDALLTVAALRMHQSHVGSVIVTDGDRAIGIVTERDVMKATALGTDPATAKVSELMTSPVETVPSDLPAREALLRLRERGYRHAPVVDPEGTTIGMASLRDLMRVAEISLDSETVDVPRAEGRHRDRDRGR